MEFTNRNYIKIGLFLVFGLFVILASIFMLGADRSLLTRQARLHARFKEVQGLDRGSVVSLSGVTVGNIEKINFLTDEKLLDVVMKIELQYLPQIPQGSQVEIRTQGALGDKFIFIIPSDGKEPVKNGDLLEVARATDFINIISERGKEAEKVFDIINEMLILTKSLNAENKLGKIIDHLSTTTQNLSVVSTEARKFSSEADLGNNGKKLKDSVDRLDSILQKIDRGQGTLGALVNDSSIHDQLKGFLGGTQRKNHLKSVIRTSIEKSEQP